MKITISKTNENAFQRYTYIATGYNEEGLYLFQDSGWNDYGYYSHFKVFYFPSESADKWIPPIELGKVLLCPDRDEMSELYNYIDKKIELKNDIILEENAKMCSCPISLLFYFNLFKLLKDISLVEEALKLLGDVTQLSDDQISSYKDNSYIFKSSILRDDGVSSPNMFRFIKTIKQDLAFFDESQSSINLILHFYEEASKLELGNIKKICADLGDCELEYTFISPLIDRILEAIEEKSSDINEKDLCFYELKYSLSDYGEPDEKNSLLYVLQNIIKIRKVLLFKWDTSFDLPLGHYTNLKTVPKLISFGKDNYFRFTNAAQLNDPLEGKAIFDFLNKAITPDPSDTSGKSNKISPSSNCTYFIASATAQSDSLPMWEQYTDDADGVYLTFSEEYFERISQIAGMKFGKICYLTYTDQRVDKCIIDNEQNDTVTNCLNNIVNAMREDSNLFSVNNGLITRLTEISFLFKRFEYSYEREYRIFIESNVEQLDEFDSKKDYMKIADKTDLTVVTEDDGNPVPRLRIAITACPIVYKRIKLGPKAISRDYVEPYVKACYKKNQLKFNKGGHIRYHEISVDESIIQFR